MGMVRHLESGKFAFLLYSCLSLQVFKKDSVVECSVNKP